MWLLHSDPSVYGPWPASGEIDVVEGFNLGNGNNSVQSTTHYGIATPPFGGTSSKFDLGQSPADVIFLTAADSEISLLSHAFGSADHGYSLRLANLMQLKHPMSVDVYLARTCVKAKLIVARLLGGRGYWSYLIDELSVFCA